MRPALFAMFFPACCIFGVVLGSTISACQRKYHPIRREYAVSRPWFPRDAMMPAAERDLRDAIAHCNGPWDGLSNIEREPCRLRCFASDRSALWSRLLSESVCERLR